MKTFQNLERGLEVLNSISAFPELQEKAAFLRREAESKAACLNSAARASDWLWSAIAGLNPQVARAWITKAEEQILCLGILPMFFGEDIAVAEVRLEAARQLIADGDELTAEAKLASAAGLTAEAKTKNALAAASFKEAVFEARGASMGLSCVINAAESQRLLDPANWPGMARQAVLAAELAAQSIRQPELNGEKVAVEARGELEKIRSLFSRGEWLGVLQAVDRAAPDLQAAEKACKEMLLEARAQRRASKAAAAERSRQHREERALKDRAIRGSSMPSTKGGDKNKKKGGK